MGIMFTGYIIERASVSGGDLTVYSVKINLIGSYENGEEVADKWIPAKLLNCQSDCIGALSWVWHLEKSLRQIYQRITP